MTMNNENDTADNQSEQAPLAAEDLSETESASTVDAETVAEATGDASAPVDASTSTHIDASDAATVAEAADTAETPEDMVEVEAAAKPQNSEPTAEATDSEKEDAPNGETTQPAKQKKQKKGQPAQMSKAELKKRHWAQRQVESAFAACVRCGYFLSDYKVLHGNDHFKEIVGTNPGGWLELTWSPSLRHILEKSFGIEIAVNTFHYKGRCDSCGRAFIYEASEDEDGEPTVRIQVRPRHRTRAEHEQRRSHRR